MSFSWPGVTVWPVLSELCRSRGACDQGTPVVTGTGSYGTGLGTSLESNKYYEYHLKCYGTLATQPQNLTV